MSGREPTASGEPDGGVDERLIKLTMRAIRQRTWQKIRRPMVRAHRG